MLEFCSVQEKSATSTQNAPERYTMNADNFANVIFFAAHPSVLAVNSFLYAPIQVDVDGLALKSIDTPISTQTSCTKPTKPAALKSVRYNEALIGIDVS